MHILSSDEIEIVYTPEKYIKAGRELMKEELKKQKAIEKDVRSFLKKFTNFTKKSLQSNLRIKIL